MLDILRAKPLSQMRAGVTKGCCLRKSFMPAVRATRFAFLCRTKEPGSSQTWHAPENIRLLWKKPRTHQGPNVLIKATCSPRRLREHNVLSLLLLSVCFGFDPLAYTAQENSQWDLIFWNLKEIFPVKLFYGFLQTVFLLSALPSTLT